MEGSRADGQNPATREVIYGTVAYSLLQDFSHQLCWHEQQGGSLRPCAGMVESSRNHQGSISCILVVRVVVAAIVAMTVRHSVFIRVTTAKEAVPGTTCAMRGSSTANDEVRGLQDEPSLTLHPWPKQSQQQSPNKIGRSMPRD